MSNEYLNFFTNHEYANFLMKMSFNKRNCGGKINPTGSFELIKSVANYSKSKDIVHAREWSDLIEKDQNMIKGQTDQG